MTSIVVDDELAKAIARSPGMVEVRNRGDHFGIHHARVDGRRHFHRQQRSSRMSLLRSPGARRRRRRTKSRTRRTSATFSRPAARSHVWVSTVQHRAGGIQTISAIQARAASPT